MRVLGSISLGLTALALLQQPAFAQTKADKAEKIKAPAAMPAGEPAPGQTSPIVKPAPLVPGSSDSCCLADSCACPSPCCEEDHGLFGCGRIAIFADYLYLTVRGTDLAFAQPRDGCTSLAVPRGAVGTADPDFNSGYRVGAGFALSPCNSIRVSYLSFESTTNSSITAPDGLFIHSLLTFPTTQSCAADSVGAASAKFDHDLRQVDLEFKSIFASSCRASLGYIVGVRYAHLEQGLTSNFIILGDTAVDTSIKFDGVGPRLGVEGEVYGGGGFFGYGRGLANFLVGHFSASFAQTNVFAGTQAQTSYDNDRVVPVFDLELGVGWQSQGGNLVVRVGYLIEAWCNTVTTPDFIEGVRASNFTTNGGNLRDWMTFDGLTARVEVRF